MMGSGKSSIGRIISQQIDYNFIDIDKLIEKKRNKSISKIFEEEGEKYFRQLEEEVTINALQNKNTIISLGGGAIVNNKIRSYIKKNSFNIYLKVSIDILNKRLQNSKNRPLINKKDLTQTLKELFEEREKFYQTADLIIKNEKNVNDTIKNIFKKLKDE